MQTITVIIMTVQDIRIFRKACVIGNWETTIIDTST